MNPNLFDRLMITCDRHPVLPLMLAFGAAAAVPLLLAKMGSLQETENKAR